MMQFSFEKNNKTTTTKRIHKRKITKLAPYFVPFTFLLSIIWNNELLKNYIKHLQNKIVLHSVRFLQEYLKFLPIRML